MTTGSEVTPNPNGRAPAGPLRALVDGTAGKALSFAHRAGEAALEKLPLNEIMDLVDIQALLDRVDVESLIERVDVEAIIERVDVQKIIDRVDVEAIIDRVDVQKIIDRVDINAVVGKVDLDSVLQKTDLGQVIAQSTGGIASSGVDLLRRQGVGLDGFVARWAARLRRSLRDAPAGPPLLAGGQPS